jgi:tetratricopeptide (TPR) repeat protein
MALGPIGKRLDGWKEVASHLGRGERTVKRWDVERGLPIHRVPGAGRATIYAYTVELDEWLKSRNAQDLEAASEVMEASVTEPAALPQEPLLEPSKPPIETQPVRHGMRHGWTVALAALVLVGAAVAGVRMAALRHRSVLYSKAGAIGESRRPATGTAASPVSDSDKRQAHELYLKGRYEWSQRTPESLNRALDAFTQAAVRDPYNAESYVGLADTYNLLQIYSTLPLADSAPRATAAAKRAVQLDDSMAEAHRALAFAEFYGDADYKEAEREFRRAIELNPNDAVTRRWYGNAFAVRGRYEASLKQFEKAQELDPASHSTLSDEGIVLYNMGRKEEGIAMLREVERTDPEFFSPHTYLMEIDLERHDLRDYLDEGRKAARTRNDPVLRVIIASVRTANAKNGETGFWKTLYAKQEEFYSQGKFPPGLLAMTCVATGRRHEALHLLDGAYSSHRPDGLWIMTKSIFGTLRDEPGYGELVTKINFPGFSDGSPAANPISEGSPLQASR